MFVTGAPPYCGGPGKVKKMLLNSWRIRVFDQVGNALPFDHW
jgi:hypothetical protein